MIYLTQSLHRNCQKFPNKLVTIYNDRQQTWSQFKERIAKFAGALQTLGVEQNDRVAILALNSDRYLEFYMSVPWAGGAVVALNTRWSVKENAYSLNDSRAKILLVDDAYVHQVEMLKEEDVPVSVYIYIVSIRAKAYCQI